MNMNWPLKVYGLEESSHGYSVRKEIMGVRISVRITTLGVIPFLRIVLSRLLFPRFFGEKKWNESKPVIAAGLVSGSGLAAAIAVASSLIMKATWIKPW